MDQAVLDYLKTQRIGVLAIEMLDGSPHAATVHFAHAEEPLMFFFKTNRDYRKAEPLLNKESTRASFVVGSDEGNMKTMQLDGEARLLKSEEKDLFEKVFFGKFPEKSAKASEEAVLFVFIPTWWRFTDWTRPKGKLILTSNS